MVLKPQSVKFSNQLGEIVLDAEVKSTNSILTQVLLFFWRVKTEWRAAEMASSVDLLTLKANW